VNRNVNDDICTQHRRAESVSHSVTRINTRKRPVNEIMLA